MIGIVLVSHSQTLAQGVLQLARRMVRDRVPIALAAGTDNPDEPVGTDPIKVLQGIEAVYSNEGVLVLMDLGSALMSVEAAIEFLDPGRQPNVYLCEASLVEGGLAAAVAAAGGGTIDFVIAAAREALADKTAQLLPVLRIPPAARGEPDKAPLRNGASIQNHLTLELTIMLPNRLGLHARPAARLVNTLAAFAADVQLEHKGRLVNARSLNNLVTLGTRQGDTLTFRASGADASAALQSIQTLGHDNFGDRDETPDETPQFRSSPLLSGAACGYAQGIAASPGTAVGPVYLFDQHTPTFEEQLVTDLDAAWLRLTQAIDAVRADLAALEQKTARTLGASVAAIFQAQQLMLADPDMLAQARIKLDATGLNAEAVWQRTIDETMKGYQALDDAYLRARAADLEDLGRRVLRHLCGESGKTLTLDEPSILVAADLHPSDTARLPTDQVLGLLLQRGGATSHSAILARSLGIPAVVSVARALGDLEAGQIVGFDGSTGQVWLTPTATEVEALKAQRAARQTEQQRLLEPALAPTYTQDGKRIVVAANIARPVEAQRAARLGGAEGVGLFRTEFLFMDRAAPPSEEEQFVAYCAAARAFGGAQVIIRTLDVGGDKPIAYLNQQREANPFLGLRGIRLCLTQPALFKTQLCALLRAGANHNIKIMLPMIDTLHEVRQAKLLLQEAQRELEVANVCIDHMPEIGIMIETPAAVWAASALAQEIDFFSIGSNDLTQYVMAADRGNASVAELVTSVQPPVLHAIRQVVEAAHAAGIWVGICGGAGGKPAGCPAACRPGSG